MTYSCGKASKYLIDLMETIYNHKKKKLKHQTSNYQEYSHLLFMQCNLLSF